MMVRTINIKIKDLSEVNLVKDVLYELKDVGTEFYKIWIRTKLEGTDVEYVPRRAIGFIGIQTLERQFGNNNVSVTENENETCEERIYKGSTERTNDMLEQISNSLDKISDCLERLIVK